jgi:tyrosine-protein phosphatase YwqE
MRGFARPLGKRTAPAARLGWDFHSHLLPGVDDGMANYADARAAIAGLLAMGFTGAVLTPHVYKEVFDNDAAGLRAAFETFQVALAADGVGFPMYLAAEYFADESCLRLIEQDDILHLQVGEERWVLLEFPYSQETPFAGVCLAGLVAKGYRPVIAHVERYQFVARAPALWLDQFARVGAILQGDIGSLAGQFGEPVQRFATWLAARKLVSVWGTDLHHPAQLQRHVAPGLAKLTRQRGVFNAALAGLAA